MRNHKVAACFFRRLPHVEVAVFGALPVRIQKKALLSSLSMVLWYVFANFQDELKSDDTKT